MEVFFRFLTLAIIFLWASENLFHVAWQGNFELWIQDPLHVRLIAHAIWDPHFGQPAVEAFTRGGHMHRTNFGIGHSIQDLLEAHIPPRGRLRRRHKAQHMYSLPAYAFIAQDFTTQVTLNAVNENSNSLSLIIGLGDFLVHHAITLDYIFTYIALLITSTSDKFSSTRKFS
ncbi:hypothetical protein ZIOFF_035816 [Zingiber officinale]|uniref:Uncharacterized protein n=1 Tax=Zingiber officinale TaxID=94328 RepID=A0A8J5L859_ZINOF|nr:hypothetical protein ZIOFF_035816 [Zingiber officinale]